MASGNFKFMSRWSQDHPNLKKMCIYIYIYILAQKILFAKLTYFDHPNINVEHSDLKITKILAQSK